MKKFVMQQHAAFRLMLTAFLFTASYISAACDSPILPGTDNDSRSTIGIQFTEPVANTPMSEFSAQDVIGAMGPHQYLYNTNSGTKSYTIDRKAGTATADNVVWAGGGPFFLASAINFANGLFGDTRIRYDTFSGRWYRISLGLGNNTDLPPRNNGLYIAVSEQTDRITPTTQWFTFGIQHNLIPEADGPNHRNNGVPIGSGGDNLLFLDYPTLGVDAYNLYIGARMQNNLGLPFPCVEQSAVFVVKKESLFNGGPVIIWAYRQLKTLVCPGPSSASGISIPQGVDNLDDTHPKYGYFIGTAEPLAQPSNQFVMHKVINPESDTPVLSDPIFIEVPLTYIDALVTSPNKGNLAGVLGFVDGHPGRLLMAHARKDPKSEKTHIFTTHSVFVGANGLYNTVNPTVTNDRTAVRWYEINPKKTPVTIQSGTIWDPAAINPNFYYYPAIMTNKQGDLTVTCLTSGVNRYIDVVTFRRNYHDKPCTIGPEQLVQASSQPFNSHNNGRFVDYTYTSADPVDESDMWNISQFTIGFGHPGYVITQLKPEK